ncbi:MAG: cytidine deaminase [Candidatus Cloacimonetes bacterium]|jgi:cytidine deaminase|nr:cytidine deaminase [Candidatus Cloacimonadota bacterium]MDY0171890.1 cytidine deaminase [Candidatus Cloacimonadaceae bacterium]
MTKNLNSLLEVAREAAKQAYAPYSGFRVGSALRCKDGTVFSGCNVENASYSLSICAERAAIFKAVSEGKQDFTAIAIYVDSDKLFPPCGACRQVIHEFGSEISVIYANHDETFETTIAELLPGAFSL